jgi:hypothetical protein
MLGAVAVTAVMVVTTPLVYMAAALVALAVTVLMGGLEVL